MANPEHHLPEGSAEDLVVRGVLSGEAFDLTGLPAEESPSVNRELLVIGNGLRKARRTVDEALRHGYRLGRAAERAIHENNDIRARYESSPSEKLDAS